MVLCFGFRVEGLGLRVWGSQREVVVVPRFLLLFELVDRTSAQGIPGLLQ